MATREMMGTEVLREEDILKINRPFTNPLFLTYERENFMGIYDGGHTSEIEAGSVRFFSGKYLGAIRPKEGGGLDEKDFYATLRLHSPQHEEIAQGNGWFPGCEEMRDGVDFKIIYNMQSRNVDYHVIRWRQTVGDTVCVGLSDELNPPFVTESQIVGLAGQGALEKVRAHVRSLKDLLEDPRVDEFLAKKGFK